MRFLDTSVLVAACQVRHASHLPCRRLLEEALHEPTAVALHTYAEFFSVLTRMPPPMRVSPHSAEALLNQVRQRTKSVALTEDEYIETIQELAARGLSGGLVYDALLIRCARKVKATMIGTLNSSHFQTIAPDLAASIWKPS